MTIDFDRIRRDFPLPEIVEQSGVKLSKNGNEFEALCPFHSEDTPSFSVFKGKSGTWHFHCFGCGINGDVLDYVQERYSCENVTAAVQIIDGKDRTTQPVQRQHYIEHANPYDGYDIGRPPQGTPPIVAGEKTPPLLNPKRIDAATGKPKLVTYKPSMVFPYRNRQGDLIGYVLRVEIDGKKLTPAIWWMENKAAGFTGWSHGSFPDPRPIYGLDALEAAPKDFQVFISEGEKCKDAAARLLAERRVVSVSWMGGGKAISKTDWRALRGRSIIIWPDNDAEGWKTTLGFVDPRGTWREGLVERLYKAGAVAIKIVMVTPASRPEGWDIADAEQEGLGSRGVEIIMRDRIRPWSKEDIARYRAKKEREHADNSRRVEALPASDPNAPTDDDSEGDLPGSPEPGREAEERPGTDDNQPAPDNAAAPDRSRPKVADARQQVGRGYQITEEDFRSHMIMKADGEGLKANSIQNASLLIQYDARFKGIYAWNEFAKEVYLIRRPPWDVSGVHGHWRPRMIADPDVTATAGWLEYAGLSVKTNDVGKVIYRVAQHNSYNPVTASLDALQWDGAPRLNGNDAEGIEAIRPWLTRYFGADDTLATRAFGRKWMIGAVARAFKPGCKMDTMLIFEGPQGLAKSSALRILADAVTPGVYTDEMSDPNSKDAGMQMQGAFIIEIAELDAFRRSDTSQIKAWLSRQTDRFRRPYGKIVEEFPRACVFAGTVNPIGGGYLKDASGARRMWPVQARSIDLAALEKDAPQLWAEAVAAYRDGEKWWLEGEENEEAKAAQLERFEEDPYNDMIDNFLQGRQTTTVIAIMQDALEIPPERRNALAAKRVTTQLFRRGWIRKVDGSRVFYVNPQTMEFDQ
jgi:predicted P-loop ATPase